MMQFEPFKIPRPSVRRTVYGWLSDVVDAAFRGRSFEVERVNATASAVEKVVWVADHYAEENTEEGKRIMSAVMWAAREVADLISEPAQ